MPFFRRGSDEDRAAQEAALAEQQASLESLERGGLPLRAQQRLGELARDGGLYTSDLTVSEFALTHAIGLRPLGQVMGSSIYHVGWQGSPGTWGGWQPTGISTELTMLSDAWNTARSRAFGRLEQEAKLLGAHAVVGVRLTTAGHDWALGAIEYVAVGTAVRFEGADAPGDPVVTDLSGQAYRQLRDAGYEPLGVVGATSVVYVVSGWQQQRAQQGWGSWANQELTDFTAGIYDARELALGRVSRQARSQGASGMVGVTIGHSVEEREVNQRVDLVVTVHVLGTSIGGAGDHLEQTVPSLVVDLASDSHPEHVLGGSA